MKKLLFGLLVFLLLIGAVACGGGSATTEVYSGSHDYETVAPKSYYPPTTTTTALVTMPAPMPPVTVTQTAGGGESYTQVITTDRMVIYNAYMTIVVDDVSTTLAKIEDLAKKYGGFVVNSNIAEDQSRLYAYISFRVLAERFNDTIQALHNLAIDVKAEQTSGQDVTEEYTDLSSKLRNLEASETQLLELMKQAGSVEEILAVQKELTSTREQIEVIKGRMQYLEQSSNLALFTVTLEQSKLMVEFYADTRTVNEEVAVPFNPTVYGGFYPYTFEWDFGDGETSNEVNPLHVYHSAGVFTVSLKVTDDKSYTADYVREDYITVRTGWSAGSVVDSAWAGLVGFGHALSAFFIGLGIFSPVWIVILAIVLYFAWWRRRKKSRKN
jgi:hypothetical protein